MKHYFNLFLILNSITLLTLFQSCSSSKIHPVNKEIVSKRLEIPGVSVLPPPGLGWYYQIDNPNRIFFFKEGKYKTQTLFASVSLHKLPATDSEQEFLSELKREIWQAESNSKFEVIFQEEIRSNEKQSNCARLNRIYKEYDSRFLPRSVNYFLIKDICLTCKHPGNQEIGVSVCLSERSWPGREFKDFEKISDYFIANARFEKVDIE